MTKLIKEQILMLHSMVIKQSVSVALSKQKIKASNVLKTFGSLDLTVVQLRGLEPLPTCVD
jgi:hypothetical protein